MSETSYTVPAIHCAHCADTIREDVGEVEGVETVEVDVGTKIVTVRGAEFSDQSVRSALREAGYEPA